MGKKISLGAAIAFMAIIAAATFSVTMVFSMRTFNSKVYSLMQREKMYDKVAEVDDYVRQKYNGTIIERELRDATVAGYLAGIGDEYAEYYSATVYARMKEDYGDKSVQIGIVTEMDESGYIRVTEVYPDSPAQAAGIEMGDLIVKIDDTDITSENYVEASRMLYGEAGTKMNIILRKGVEDSSLEMTRRFVEIPSVSSEMLENNIGLMKIEEFNDNTPDQFTKQIDGLIDAGAQGVIFDVRNVETGTLESVAQILDKLLPKGVLVSSTDKNGETTILETSDEREVNLPMAVVVNERTSGEAELFAQAIKDYQKGRIIGTKTAGKGSMQTIFPLSDGSAIKITTAIYNPPGGVTFDKEGVRPDFEVKMSEEQTLLAQVNGYDSDLQIKKAIEVVIAAIKAENSDTSSSESVSSAAASVVSSSSSQSSSEEASSEDSSEVESGSESEPTSQASTEANAEEDSESSAVASS